MVPHPGTITHVVQFDYLIKMASARLLHCEVTLFVLKLINIFWRRYRRTLEILQVWFQTTTIK